MRSFSKFVVAAAVASACGYAAASAVSNSAARDYSAEALANAVAATDLNITATVSLNDNFANTDHLLFTANTGVSFGSISHFSTTLSCSVIGGAAGSSITFALDTTNSSASQIRYNVSGTPGSVAAGAVCAGSAANPGVANTTTLSFKANSLSATRDTSVTVRRVNTNGSTFDVSSAGTMLSVASEYTIGAASALDGVVDVQGGRLSFQSGGDTTVAGFQASAADSFAISVNRATRIQPAGLSVTGSLQITLTAGTSFAFLQEPTGQTGGGSCTITTGSGQAAATAVGAAAVAQALAFAAGSNQSGSCNSLVANFETINAGVYAIQLGRVGTYNTTNSSAFAPQTYTATSLLKQGAITHVTDASRNAGTWSLNGTTVNIPYLPLTTSGVQVMIANQSSQQGTIDYTAWNVSGVTCTGSLGTIEANGNASVGTSLRAALNACTTSGWSGTTRATVQLIVTTPSTSTTVHSGFSASDNVIRSTVINNTNGK